MPKEGKKRFPLYMYTVCHASRTMTDMSKLIPHTNKHSLVASQVPDSSPTIGTLSIRCTNLSWPKRLLLHYLLDFVGCFAFVDADNRNAMSTRRLMPKLDELYCFSAVPELINNNLLTVCRRQSSISAVSRNFFSISDNQGSRFYIQHSP